jgi:hypothetical protein
MTKILTALAVTLSNCLAIAGPVQPVSPQVKGINEPVTIKGLGTNWGYTQPMNGFYTGTARFNLVPVTREAAKVLQSLKEPSYNCVIQNSTFIPQMQGSEIVGGTYYVLDINCD